MDPTEPELNAITSLQEAADWAGTSGETHTQLMKELGTPAKLRDILFIPRPDWDAVVSAFQITENDSSGTETTRILTPTEKARIEIFRRVVFLRLGATPDGVGSTAPPTPTTGASPLPAAGSHGTLTRKLKLSSIIDPTLDAEIVQMSQDEVTEAYKRYRNKYGDHPSPDVEPSIDQLSALNQLIKSSALPYTDFSIYGPHGLRTLRRAVFSAYMLNAATGEWSKRESPGPDCLASWERCFKTFKAAMLLLEAADSERLEAYCEHIKDLHSQFGHDAWGIIYTADCRMRSEFHERASETT